MKVPSAEVERVPGPGPSPGGSSPSPNSLARLRSCSSRTRPPEVWAHPHRRRWSTKQPIIIRRSLAAWRKGWAWARKAAAWRTHGEQGSFEGIPSASSSG